MILTANIPPIINVGPSGGGTWLKQGYRYGVNDSGPYQMFTAEGTLGQLEADAINFILAGWTVDIEYLTGGFGVNGIGRMTCSAGWTGTGTGGINYVSEVLTSAWELDPEETDKGLLEANFPFTGTANLGAGVSTTLALTTAPGAFPLVPLGSGSTRLAIQVAVDDSNPQWTNTGVGALVLSNGVTYVFDNGDTPGSYSSTFIPLPSADYAPAYSLFKLMQAGSTQFPIDAPRIKHTQTFSNLYDTQFNFIRVGQIISDITMYQQEGVPQDILFSVAATSQTTGTVDQFIETPGDLAYGWKKSYPEITKLALYKWRVTQYYQLGLWPLREFGAIQ